MISFEEVGEAYPVDEIVVHDVTYGKCEEGYAEGSIAEALEKFGNISTNILNDDFEKTGIKEGDWVHIQIKEHENVIFDSDVLYHRSFGFVEIGEPVLFNGLASFMALGLNQRSFAEKYQIKGGEGWTIRIERKENA